LANKSIGFAYNKKQEMEHIIIDNCVVSKFNANGLSISSKNLFGKKHPQVNIDSLPVILTGNRQTDNNLLHKLSDGLMSFDELVEMYQLIQTKN